MRGTRTHARSIPVTGQREHSQRVASNIPTQEGERKIHKSRNNYRKPTSTAHGHANYDRGWLRVEQNIMLALIFEPKPVLKWKPITAEFRTETGTEGETEIEIRIETRSVLCLHNDIKSGARMGCNKLSERVEHVGSLGRADRSRADPTVSPDHAFHCDVIAGNHSNVPKEVSF
ncbi:hypothetical protein EVAR_78490_1 [Eumeta japonica]|uniref:Uncharacterized protein n=1 Tax=Eumeta variegata TaxID=151549 RepID=A0A4C1TY86_EUMVA|nr:hypothetical protein EVAR_78490_1 [Eumeta japonica]